MIFSNRDRGIGACGIITEVVVKAGPRFNVEQKPERWTWAYVKEHLDQLIEQHVHLSLYLLPFTDRCQINTWNPARDESDPSK